MKMRGVGKLKRKLSSKLSRSKPIAKFQKIEADLDDIEAQHLKVALRNSRLILGNGIDLSQIPGCPVVHPTEIEFQDPIQYIKKLHKTGMRHGAIQIVPPKSWKAELNISFPEKKFDTRIQNVHELSQGRGFPGGKKYTLDEFQRMAAMDEKGILTEQFNGIPGVEKLYWRVANGRGGEVSVEYGNDIDSEKIGIGFGEKNNSPWNLRRLAKHPDSPLSCLENVTGVTVPWIYIGMIFSSFCWHCEDHYLPSINYLHTGKPKVWYCVPARQSKKLEDVMKQNMPCLFEDEPDLMHKLCTTLDPRILAANGVKIHRVIQTAGTFVVTFPHCYHSGFNTGFNVAEAVNICYNEWFPIGRRASEIYRSISRQSVFEHEMLLAKWILQHTENIPPVLQKELTQALKQQKKTAALVTRKGTQTSSSPYDYNEEEHRCFICNQTCYLWHMKCSCSEAVMCLKHATEDFCGCGHGSKSLVYSIEFWKLTSLEWKDAR